MLGGIFIGWVVVSISRQLQPLTPEVCSEEPVLTLAALILEGAIKP